MSEIMNFLDKNQFELENKRLKYKNKILDVDREIKNIQVKKSLIEEILCGGDLKEALLSEINKDKIKCQYCNN